MSLKQTILSGIEQFGNHSTTGTVYSIPALFAFCNGTDKNDTLTQLETIVAGQKSN